MYFNRIALKEDAKAKVASATPPTFVPTLAYMAILYLISLLETQLDERFSSYVEQIYNYALFGAPWPAFRFSTVLRFSALFILLLRIVSSVFATGYQWYSLRISRNLSATFSNILDPLNYLLKVVGLKIAISIFTFLWSLLLVIPGIIASYSYRQAYYILHDHPEYGIMQCIRESKRLMRGYKFDLFMLDLSFLGWYFLCYLTLGILFIWKLPYLEVTYANFYGALTFNRDFGGAPWDFGGSAQ